MKNMKLSDIFKRKFLNIIKDTNGDFYIKGKMCFLYDNLKDWTYAGNNLRSVIDAINDTVVKPEIEDILYINMPDGIIKMIIKDRGIPKTVEEAVNFLETAKKYAGNLANKLNLYGNVEDALSLLRAFADPEKYVEDDIKPEFITKDKYVRHPDFRFNFTDIGQGVGYKADTSGYNWKDIPDDAILYIPECYAGTWGCKASDVYTKSDLEKCINDRVMDDEHFINAETMFDELSWEMPESFLDGLDFDYKKIAYCVGDKLYYNLNEFDSPAHSIPVTVTEVNENNIVCKDSTGTSYMFDEDMLDCVTNNPMYLIK
jgi:hypothetical protein